MKNKKRSYLFIILLIAAFLRFYNLMHDAPYFFNPDERNMAIAVTRFRLPNRLSSIPSCIYSEFFSSQLAATNCSLNPHFFAYGQFPLYLAYVSDQLIKPFSNVMMTQFNAQQSTTSNLTYLSTSFPSAIFWLRFWSASSSVFTVLFVYLISRKLFTFHFSLFTAAAAAFTPGLIQSAHFGTTESLLTFLFLTSIYLSLRYFRELNNLKFVILTSIVIGLALGSKLTGIFLFIPAFLALLIRMVEVLAKRTKNKIPKLLVYWFIGLLVLIGSIGIFILSSPYNLVEPENFRSAVFGYEKDVAMGKFPAFYTRQFVDTIPVVFQAEKIFPYVLGWPVFILGTIGFLLMFSILISNFIHFIINRIKYQALSIRKRKQPPSLLATYYFLLTTSFLIYFLPNSFLFAKWTRFMTPILPFFAIFTAFGVQQIYKFITDLSVKDQKLNIKNQSLAKNSKLLSFHLVFISSLLSFTLLPGVAFMSIYTNEDARITASKWIYDNLPDNSYILSETANVVDIPLGLPNYTLKPKSYNLTVISFDFYHLDENPRLFESLITHLAQADYILIPSRRIFANYPKFPDKFPLITKYYQLLFSGRLGFEKVAEISSFPQLTIEPSGRWPYARLPVRQGLLPGVSWQFPDEQSEETYTVFDHPVVRIYKKTKSLTAEDYKILFLFGGLS